METNVPTRECVDAEQIAALIDAQLDTPSRDQVIAHLADCQACYEIYAETLSFVTEPPPVSVARDESGRLDDAAVLARGFSWSALQVATLATAALALLTFGVFVAERLQLFPQSSSDSVTVPSVASPAELARLSIGRGAPSLGGGWPAPEWGPNVERPVTRGAEISASPADFFRLGVLAVDFEVAGLLGDEATQSAQASRIERLERRINLASTLSDAASVDRAINARLDLDDLVRAAYAFGKWAEAGRIAAQAGNAGFFASAGSDLARFRQVTDLPAHDRLGAIADAMETAGGETPDLGLLRDRLSDLVSAGGSQ